MAMPGSISGVVTDAGSGALLAGVTVGYPGGVTTTNGVGAYQIAGLGAGVHNLTFAATGYVSFFTLALYLGGLAMLHEDRADPSPDP